jgi:Domain of unknown function (DUF4340)
VEAALRPARRRGGLLAVWLALAALGTAIVVIEYTDRRRATSAHDGTTDAGLLLLVPVDQLGAVEIADRGRLHRFERDAAGAWFYHGVHTAATGDHTHAVDPALAERIARALAAFGRTRIERQFALERGSDAYGLAAPEMVVLVYRPDQPQPIAQYAVGHVAPDTTSRYVTRVGTPVVMTIAAYQVDNLLALVQAAGEQAGRDAAGR